MKKIYAILDTLAGVIVGGLHTFPHDAPAVRFFSDIAGDPQTMIGRHPDDHALICLGTLSDDNHIMPFADGNQIVITGAAWKASQAPTEANG